MTSKTLSQNGWNLLIGTGSEVYLHNVDATLPHPQFVARFKHGSPKACANHFAKFLVANFTPAEYFSRLAAGAAPGKILEERGYVNYNVAKLLKREGFATFADYYAAYCASCRPSQVG